MAPSNSSFSAFGVEPQALTINAEDGFPIALQRFDPPAGSSVRAICVIANATGVQARFYHPIAAWLAMQGVATFTMDFRYSGISFPPEDAAKLAAAKDEDEADEVFEAALLRAPEDIGLTRTWGRVDLAAVVRYANKSHPGVPLTMMGNSLGGHLIAILEPEMYKSFGVPIRMLNVCGGNAHWRNHAEPLESRWGFTEMIVGPLKEERIFRASNLGLGFDIPYGIGQDWVGWFMHPCFSLNKPQDEKNAKANAKLAKWIYVGFEDDETITERMMEAHASLLCGPGSNTQTLWVDPKQNARWPKCGHVTSFRPTGPSMASSAGQSEDDDADEEGAQQAMHGGEAYKSASHDDKQADKERTLAREETIWQLYLRWIIEGEVDGSLGKLKKWDETNARDCEQLRREQAQVDKEEAAEKAKEEQSERRARL